ncbi:hypothetical protein KNP414_01987 [Paenibacillus mucilaginosus KNP414]|uniref:Uncharacterized protein n=1 Tax=Paenibacillus mucilaginosus (strain KNP414) TaxID=1036673 RepID=F8FRJ1_PAEMK|nr:hypothetical protein KNP414_01987 [Paenibacillus mucilaginosus KNP414]
MISWERNAKSFNIMKDRGMPWFYGACRFPLQRRMCGGDGDEFAV